MRTSLYDEHLALNGRMVEFGGWELPVQYTSIIEEHHAVRKSAGLFDVSHLGDLVLRGPDSEKFLRRVLTNDVANLADGTGQYSIIPNHRGGTVDDIIIYRLAADNYFLVINASNIEKDTAWLNEQRDKENTSIAHESFNS